MQQRFKIGDKIKVNDLYHVRHGQIGEVIGDTLIPMNSHVVVFDNVITSMKIDSMDLIIDNSFNKET